MSKFVGSTAPYFAAQLRSPPPTAQYKEVASKKATKAKGGTRKGPAAMGYRTQGLDWGGRPVGDLQRRV